MPAGNPWTRAELLVAFALYLKLPLRMHHGRHPEVVEQAARMGRAPAAIAMKLGNIRSLDDSITRTGLRNASNADREMWAEMQSDWPRFVAAAEAALEAADPSPTAGEQHATSDPATGAASSPAGQHPGGADIPVQSTRRRGQALFRQTVLSAYRNQCALTGLADQRLLIASHIIPWSEAPAMRLNPRNGIALNALHDRAFDRGLITFTEDLRLQISPALEADASKFTTLVFQTREGHQLAVPDKFGPDPTALAYHRDHIFQLAASGP